MFYEHLLSTPFILTEPFVSSFMDLRETESKCHAGKAAADVRPGAGLEQVGQPAGTSGESFITRVSSPVSSRAEGGSAFKEHLFVAPKPVCP